MRKYQPGKKYKKLDVDFEIPEYAAFEIDNLMECVNEYGGSCDDCIREDIRNALKYSDVDGELTTEQKELLMDYYVWGGIYEHGI